MPFDLRDIPLADMHMHRFHPGREHKNFFTVVGPYATQPTPNYKNQLLYGMLIRELTRMFGLPRDTPDDEVIAVRNERYHSDPQGYYARMMDDANVEVYCAEIGSPLGADPYSPDEIAWYNSVIPAHKRRNIVRIERLMDTLFEEYLPFETFIDEFHKRIDQQIIDENAIALKTVIAYYGGNRVVMETEQAAKAAYARFIDNRDDREAQVTLYNYMVAMGLDACIRNDIPMQFHTGGSGHRMLDLETMSPIWLNKVFKDPRYFEKVKIIILHCGYPHVEETALIVHQFEQVYTDLSYVVPYSGIGLYEKMLNLFEKAPLNKVCYGSDGHTAPEFTWFAPVHFRRVFSKVLRHLWEEDVVTESRAWDIAHMICHQNAHEIYTKLDA